MFLLLGYNNPYSESHNSLVLLSSCPVLRALATQMRRHKALEWSLQRNGKTHHIFKQKHRMPGILDKRKNYSRFYEVLVTSNQIILDQVKAVSSDSSGSIRADRWARSNFHGPSGRRQPRQPRLSICNLLLLDLWMLRISVAKFPCQRTENLARHGASLTRTRDLLIIYHKWPC